ncbi:hypothetical protein D3C81_1016460 [compost metagenome]
MEISKTVVIVSSLVLLLTACSTETSSTTGVIANQSAKGSAVKTAEPSPSAAQTPEPLRLASEQLSKGDVDRTLTYLGLTISDFPGTDAEYIARLIESAIFLARSQSNAYILDSLTKGSKNSSSSLLGAEGLQRQIDVLGAEIETSKKDVNALEPKVTYILENYEKHERLQVNPAFKYTLTASNKDLTFYENVGYPIPSDYEISEAKQYAFEYLLQDLLGKVIKDDGTVDYTNYFYFAGTKLSETKSGPDVLDEVLRLTESNKYDERRLSILEYRKAQE